jgi:hypothetical protein
MLEADLLGERAFPDGDLTGEEQGDDQPLEMTVTEAVTASLSLKETVHS